MNITEIFPHSAEAGEIDEARVLEALKIVVEVEKISQGELAKKSGTGQPVLSRLFSGKTKKPQAETLRRLAETIAGSVEGLLQKAEEREPGFLNKGDRLSLDGAPKSPRAGEIQVDTGKVTQLLAAVDGLLQGVFNDDGKQTLSTLVKVARDLVNAEACAIFLLPAESDSEELVLEASICDRIPPKFRSTKRIRMISEPRGGLTAHVADCLRAVDSLEQKGASINLRSKEIEESPYPSGTYHEHLAAGRCYSFLGVALRDRKNRFLGILTLQNKKGIGQEASAEICFTVEDVKVAELMAKKCMVVLDLLRCFEVFPSIIQDLQESHDLPQILKRILKRAISLVGADRGDFAIWDNNRADLYVQGIEGHTGPTAVKLNQPAPKGFMRSLWVSTAEYKVSNNVAEEKQYYASHKSVKSELAVRLDFKGRPIGILNVESFSLGAFDSRDRDLLMLLARYAATAVEVNREETQLKSLTQTVLDAPEDAGIRDILNRILETVRTIYGFEAGLIYIADEERLWCRASIGCEKLRIDPLKYYHPINGVSAAAQVYQTREGFFSSHPETDTKVNKAGLDVFEIKGPIVGVPLLSGNRRVGVLIAWSRENPPPTQEHIVRLKPLAKLAAWRISLWQSRNSEIIYKSLVNTVPLSVFRKDLDGRFTFVNQEFCRSVNRGEDEILGKTDKEIYPGSFAAKFRDDDLEVIRTGKKIVGKKEPNQVSAEAPIHYVSVTKVPVLDEKGEVIGVQGAFLDITKEDKLEKLYKCVADFSPDAIVVHQNKTVKFVNAAALKLVGAENHKQVLGKNVLDFVHRQDKERVSARIVGMLQSGKTEESAVERWLTLTGQTVQVEVLARPIPEVDPGTVLVIAREIQEKGPSKKRH